MNTFSKKKISWGLSQEKSPEWTSETPHEACYVLPNAPIVCTVLCPWGGPARDNKKRQVLWNRGAGDTQLLPELSPVWQPAPACTLAAPVLHYKRRTGHCRDAHRRRDLLRTRRRHRGHVTAHVDAAQYWHQAWYMWNEQRPSFILVLKG